MTLVNPFKKSYCFFCGKSFHLGQCAIYSSLVTNSVVKDAPTGWRRWLSFFWVPPLDGYHNIENLPCRQCPHCEELLPSNMELVRNIVLAVIGDVSAGKTLYIAALIKEMLAGQILQMNEFVNFIALNQDVDKKYRNELAPFFTTGKPLPNTPAVKDARTDKEKLNAPWIYKLTMRKSPTSPPVPMNLIIYDASGEDLRDIGTVVKYRKYLLNPDAIIYMADPLKMPGIERRIPKEWKPTPAPTPTPTPAPTADVSADFVLRWITDLIQQSGGYSSSIPIPLAITLSKSDLLDHIKPDATFHQEANYRRGLDREDLLAVDREVRDLLDESRENNLVAASRAFSKSLFFAISVTGQPLDPRTQTFPNPIPRRCLDPLLWILAQLSVIETKQDQEAGDLSMRIPGSPMRYF